MGCDSSTLTVQNPQPRFYSNNHYNMNQPSPQIHPTNSYQNQYQPQYYTPQQQPIPSQIQPNQSYTPQAYQPPGLNQTNNGPVSPHTPIENQIRSQNGQNKKQSLKFSNKRGVMSLHLNKKDSFLTHHLKNEMHLSKYARADLIRRRQVLQHNTYEQILSRCYGENTDVINQYAKKVFFQRVILQIFETAHKQFFDQGKSYDQVRQKIAQRYLFELYQNKQFIDAGLGKFSSFLKLTQLSMSDVALVSDSALFPILRFLKEKYPQVADKTTIQFPEVKQKKQDINLLDNFPSKCYSTPGLINVQTLFSDLKFMIDRSVEQFSDFQNDMKEMLGDDVLTDSKVKKINKDGQQQYSASPVRRVFIKWAETIIERIPNIIVSQAFLDFIRSKSIIADNFYFKSTVQPTTHGKVIDILCKLIQAAKYQISSLAKRKQFGFYIYDLLRCKTKRSTGQEICELLKKMQETKVTASGKRFEVVRVKNRFKTPNRDLMVNFRYGDVIVGQAQLCIDTSDVSQVTKKTNKFNHYIYELERGLFGPTCELIMQYEDFQRKDISANLRAEGRVEKRVSKKQIDYLKKSTRKCLNNHEMIKLQGNHFVKNQEGRYEDSTFFCDYCQHVFQSDESYYYCYFCTIVFCHECDEVYKQQNLKQLQLRCNRDELVPELRTQEDIKKVLPQCPIIIFYLSDAPSSIIYKDLIVFLIAYSKMQKKPIPPLYRICCDRNDKAWVESKYNFKEYPTSIVFSKDGTPQTTLIGASWPLLEGLIEAQSKISQNQPKALEVMCCCGTNFRQTSNENDQEIFCINCGNVNQSQGLLDVIMGQDNSKVFVCQNGAHCRCLNCGFLSNDQPSRYKDYRGRSYLFQTKTEPKLPKCKMGHQIIHQKKFMQTQQFCCFNCQKDSILNNVYGVGFCQACNNYCCSRCLGFEDQSLQNIKDQMIIHTAQATAEQGERCLCNRLFKKVYNTRDYSLNILQNKEEGQDRTRQLLESVYQPQIRNWTCLICQQTKKDGELHLACFNCPKMFGIQGMSPNIEICIECAIGTDMLNRQLQPKITQVATQMVCKSNHPVVRTKLAHSNEEMTFDCTGCRKTFYIFSERYYCKSCQINVCFSCSSQHLTNKNPPKCLRKCNQSHTLKLFESPQSLKLCDGCKITIRKNHFACPLNCGFDLCLQCAATAPGVDTTNNRMQHINKEQVKRRMQEYERGWIDQIGDVIKEQQQFGEIQGVVDEIQNGLQQLSDLWNF